MKKQLLLIVLAMQSCALVAEAQAPACKNKNDCADLNNSCQCYCSRICGFRDKEADDKPVYVANDPHGHYCYCKQWDKDEYEKRGCDVKEKKKKKMKAKKTKN